MAAPGTEDAGGAAAALSGDHGAREDFKNAVKSYIDLHDDIQAGSRHLRELRKRKTELARVILQFMKENEIDECALQDGKLIRRQTKKLEPLKKEHIFDELRAALRGVLQSHLGPQPLKSWGLLSELARINRP